MPQTLKLLLLQTEPLKLVLDEDDENRQAVNATGEEIRRRGFGEISRRHGDFGYTKTGMDELGNYLLVENKVIGVHHEIYRVQYIAFVGSVAGVEFK
jgi:hypothetical protein